MTKKQVAQNNCCRTCGIPIKSSLTKISFCSNACEELTNLRATAEYYKRVCERQRAHIAETKQRLCSLEDSVMAQAPNLVSQRRACVVWEHGDAPIALVNALEKEGEDFELIAEMSEGYADEMTLSGIFGNKEFIVIDHPIRENYVLVGVCGY